MVSIVLTRELYELVIKVVDELEKIKENRKSEVTTMNHNATITTKEEKTVEEYWEMIEVEKEDVIILNGGRFSIKPQRKECDHKPTVEEIAQFLFDTKADFVTVSHNYRFAEDSSEIKL